MPSITLGREIASLESETFEILDISDIGEDMALWCSCSTSSCCSCSSSSCGSCTSTSCSCSSTSSCA